MYPVRSEQIRAAEGDDTTFAEWVIRVDGPLPEGPIHTAPASEVARLAEENERLKQEMAEIHDHPCRFDHHGYCQTHGWLQAGECPVARGRCLLGLEPAAPDVEICGVIMRPRTIGNPTPDPARCEASRPCPRPGHEESQPDAYGRRAEPRPLT